MGKTFKESVARVILFFVNVIFNSTVEFFFENRN